MSHLHHWSWGCGWCCFLHCCCWGIVLVLSRTWMDCVKERGRRWMSWSPKYEQAKSFSSGESVHKLHASWKWAESSLYKSLSMTHRKNKISIFFLHPSIGSPHKQITVLQIPFSIRQESTAKYESNPSLSSMNQLAPVVMNRFILSTSTDGLTTGEALRIRE